jgi:hypothetical protein
MAEISTRMRGFLLDSQINNAHEISLILGCAAESDELMEKEEEESEKRLERISHLIPLLYAHAQSLSQGAVEYQRSNLPTSMGKLPDAVWWDSRKLLEQVSVAALLGAISQLVDMGLLEIPKRYK